MRNYLYILYYLRSIEKGVCVIISCIYFCYILKLVIKGQAYLYWVIDVLLQRHLMLHMLYDYKCNIHKTFLSS